MRYSSGLAVFLLVLLLSPAPAHAYIDPAAGSLFLQLLLGGAAGLAVILKLFWHRLRRLVGLKEREDETAE